jgi:hypothetical protein
LKPDPKNNAGHAITLEVPIGTGGWSIPLNPFLHPGAGRNETKART